jgi:hypothetical protein
VSTYFKDISSKVKIILLRGSKSESPGVFIYYIIFPIIKLYVPTISVVKGGKGDFFSLYICAPALGPRGGLWPVLLMCNP